MSVFINFYVWNKFIFDTIQENEYYCAFLWICSWESVTVTFLNIGTNIDSEMLSYLV